MAKEYIEREAAKARLRIWITDCVLDGDNEAADCFRDCIDLLIGLAMRDWTRTRLYNKRWLIIVGGLISTVKGADGRP